MKRNAKHFLIKRKLQLKLAFQLLLITVGFTTLVVFQIYMTIRPIVLAVMNEEMMNMVLPQLLFRMPLFILPSIFIILAISIILTHRIAGPLYRIESDLDRVISGESIFKIRLRKGDELHELVDKINALLVIMNQKPDKGE